MDADSTAPDLVLEDVACPLCSTPNDEPLLTGSDRLMGLPGEFAVVRCRGCNLARTSPRPTQDSIGFYYPSEYGPYREAPIEPPSGGSTLKARARGLVRRMLDTRATAVPPMPPGRLLEVGCASGGYLKTMSTEGWDVEGIEFSADAAKSARSLGLKVEAGAIETIDRPEASYDLIVGWMVLEHLHDPVASLRKLARWTKAEGRLALSVPDRGAAEFMLFKDRWYALQLPTHLFHYDSASLTKMLERTGWKVERIIHQRSLANLVASTGYWLSDKGWGKLGRRLADFPENASPLAFLALFPFAWVMAAIGQTGRMTVWARRTDR